LTGVFGEVEPPPGGAIVDAQPRRRRKTPAAPPPIEALRFDVVNVFDKVYEIRDGSGIGVFAPQFGPRRGFYVGISQKI
jgi:hypothetical protein